jgi:deoxyribodipyrimidine photo-lyase
MDNDDLLKTRIQQIYRSDFEGKCVLYVMSRDQRVQDNHALICAQKHAIAKNLPFAVVFCLQPKLGVRSKEHYRFMLDGLYQVEVDLAKLNIPFMMLIGDAYERLNGMFHHVSPDSLYFDFNPLKGPKTLQQKLCKVRPCNMFVVDTHNTVPLWVTSDKSEVGARTIRTKIHKKFEDYLIEPDKPAKHPIDWPGVIKTLDDLKKMIAEVLSGISLSGIKVNFKSGEQNAINALDKFIKNELSIYAKNRNDPSLDGQSDLSPYLHFGQISSLRVALSLRETALKIGDDLHLLSSPKMPQPEDYINATLQGINALIEELIVRKELSDNFCYYNEDYDSLKSSPGWAIKSLEKHKNDPREFLYNLEQLEQAQTHDPAWNSAQKQMTKTGKMHGYMRMYWAKKVLEWSPSRPHNNGTLADFSENFDMDGIAHTAARTKLPEEINNSTHFEWPNQSEKEHAQLISPLNKDSEMLKSQISNLESLTGAEWAIEVLKYLNDHYSIDGGDPNGYAGIMWSVAGVHDRPWNEREIFGVIRYMNYGGLKRKFDIESYINQWS